MKRILAVLAVVLLGLSSATAFSQAAPIARFARFVGHINTVATGGALRDQPNTGNACSLANNPSSNALSGIPAGSTIAAAYLYWGGSGATVDSQVSLNGVTVNASRTFTVAVAGVTSFGGFANVTAQVAGNGTYTFGNLTVDSSATYCGNQTVFGSWALVVIYDRAAEPLRAINVFDGLEAFQGSQINLTPDGYRIRPSGNDGKIIVVTWEGDPGNSTPLNGFSEALRFNGTTLDDGINPAGSDPVIQQFDSTINGLNLQNSYGADIDTYDISSLLVPGATSATSTYSAGQDRVFLTAQIVSVTSDPEVNLGITKTHAGSFVVGTTGTYTLTVSNAAGVEPEDNTVTVTDTLPAGLSYVSGTGTGWGCSAAAQVVTCTHAASLAAGASFPPITLSVGVGLAALGTVTNSAVVSSNSFDNNAANNTATDSTLVVGPILSTSTKTVSDLNGGDANPGDTLRYTITLNESASLGATGVSVTDDVPANVASYSIVSIPAGAINASTGPGTGANGTGRVAISNITVPAVGSVTVVFDVVIAAVTPGSTLNNTATISNPNGPGATPSAPPVVVSQSQIPGAGTKQLYLWSNPSNRLSRIQPTGTHNAVQINGSASATWTLTPTLQKATTLNAGNFNVRLYINRIGGTGTKSVTLTFANSVLGTLATGTSTITAVPTGAATLQTITLNLAAASTAPIGSSYSLTVTNNTGGNSISVWPIVGANISRIDLNSATVINVDSVLDYTATYPAATTATNFLRGSTNFIRAVVSDPFGSFDVTNATITIIDANGTTQVSNAAMTMVNDSGAATKTYQYPYAIPAAAALGGWTVRVTATEGTETTPVTDLGVGSFVVYLPLPTLVISKTSQVISDPYRGVTNPLRVPGSIQLYTVLVRNTGPGTVDGNTLVITDPIGTDSAIYVSTVSGNPVVFVDGSAPNQSGLVYVYATSVSYSSQPGGGAPFNYIPVPDVDGFDPNVRGIRIAPTGVMNAAAGATTPQFSIQFRVRVQ
ncbi:MAG TPA: DUF11 domain-containing protein [Steroidobacteraceae bacterium]|nr:DUF11 domain-containing protein [Steroidobacteraceae bacterium]